MNIDTLLSAVLALVMFSIGTSLELSDFKNVFKFPKALFTGLFLQMFFLPILAFFVCMFVPISVEFKIGILILTLCPGGATSNFINYLLDLKTALSISLTLINTLLILFTIPLGYGLFAGYFNQVGVSLSLDFKVIFNNIFTNVLLPVVLGLAFRQMFLQMVLKLRNPLKYLSSVLLAVVFAVKIFAGEDQAGVGLVIQDFIKILPVILGIHFMAMFLSYFLSKAIKIEQFRALTISIEVGLQNTTLALLITSKILVNTEISKPSIVYAMFSFFTTILFGYYFKQRILKTGKSSINS